MDGCHAILISVDFYGSSLVDGLRDVGRTENQIQGDKEAKGID